MIYVNIRITNEYDDYYSQIEVDCKESDIKNIEKILKNYRYIPMNRFEPISSYINELKKYGYNSKELKYHIEI